ncbi:MAG: VWA domain-containing protein [Planctomycetes bacterium]|nr:VWA domain-containing protein [Planctomycetota bacterium]
MEPRSTTIPLALLVLAALLPALRAQQGVSTLGDARTRALAARGTLPAPADVVVEDFVNYHRHALPEPRAGEALSLDLRWSGGLDPERRRAYLQIGLATTHLADRADLPPLALALVVDCSGSMADAGKLEAVRHALRRLAKKLRPSDEVALVRYSNQAELLRSLRPVGDGADLLALVDSLSPDASTNLHAGLMLGLEQLDRRESSAGMSRRALLLTDGIANSGVTEPAEIARDARRFLERGIDVSTIGVGETLQRDLLLELAQRGRGTAHFVGDPQDVSKVFETEFQSLVAPAARKVEVELELPSAWKLERLYGYAPRRTERGAVIPLPDLSYGATLVVIAELSERDALWSDERGNEPRARVRYVDLLQRGERVLTTEAPRCPRSAAPFADPSVKKNVAIAHLAHGLRTMAEAAATQRWAEAERCIDRPLTEARALFPSEEDPDLRRVLETARRCRELVRGELEGERW